MPAIKDVKRLSVTVLVLAGLFLLWLFMLWLHHAGHFQWAVPDRVLAGGLGLRGWMWIGAITLFALTLALALPVLGMREQASRVSTAALRQVQCQHCKAVFTIHDHGKRPLTHQCPKCRWLGVYDGTAPPVGEPPAAETRRRYVKLDLTCGNCEHPFVITDTGVRPLRIRCPDCGARGSIE